MPQEALPYDDGSKSLLVRRARIKDVDKLARAIEASLPEFHAFMPWPHVPERNATGAQIERLTSIMRDRDDQDDDLF